MTFLSGRSNFKLLDNTITEVLKPYLKKWSANPQDGIISDLRRDIIDIFQKIVALYLFG